MHKVVRSPAVFSHLQLPLHNETEVLHNIFQIPAGFAVGTRFCYFSVSRTILTSHLFSIHAFSSWNSIGSVGSVRFARFRYFLFQLTMNCTNPLYATPIV